MIPKLKFPETIFAETVVEKWRKLPYIANEECVLYLSKVDWETGMWFFFGSFSSWLGEFENQKLDIGILANYIVLKNNYYKNSPLFDRFPGKGRPRGGMDMMDAGVDLFNQIRWEFEKFLVGFPHTGEETHPGMNAQPKMDEFATKYALSLPSFDEGMRFYTQLAAQWVLSFDSEMRRQASEQLGLAICRLPPY